MKRKDITTKHTKEYEKRQKKGTGGNRENRGKSREESLPHRLSPAFLVLLCSPVSSCSCLLS
jgi:hypothetical protein